MKLAERALINKYNTLREKMVSSTQKASEALQAMTDDELFIFFAGKTYQHGRSFKDSVNNAKLLMENKEQAIKAFSR